MADDKTEGTLKQGEGKLQETVSDVKEAVGADGKADQAEGQAKQGDGKLQETVGEVKDKAGEDVEQGQGRCQR